MTENGSAPSQNRNSTKRFTIVFCILLILGAWAGLFIVSRLDFERETDRARNENAFAAVGFEEHARRIIKTADTALMHMQEQFESHGVVTEDMKKFARMTKDDLPAAHVMVNDAHGDLLYSALPVNGPSNIFGRECFQVHLRKNVDGLYISKPAKIMGVWTFFLSRRINRPDGSFAGIVSVGLDPFYFGKTYGRSIFGPDRGRVSFRLQGRALH